MIAGRGDELPVSAAAGRRHLPDGHRALGEAQHRRRGPGLGAGPLHPVRQVRFVCPHSVIRAKIYDARSARRTRRATLQVRAGQRARLSRTAASRCRSTRGLHRLRPLRRGLPGRSPTRARRQGDQHGATRRRCSSAERANIALLRDAARRTTARGSTSPTSRRPVPQPLFEFSGACAGCGETPYLSCSPAVRRPAAGRQRDRLLLDLRRQPADDALDHERGGPRPGLGELAVRGQRRVRPRLPAGGRQARRLARDAAATRWPATSAPDLVEAILAAPQITRIRDPRAARARRRAASRAGRSARTTRPRRAALRWPTTWSGAASGSSAATAGPTTSATAASTTCWPPAATSTCWCSTPRSTPTPAARPRRRRRAARSPSSPPAASARRKKDLALQAIAYGNVYVAQVAMGANAAADAAGLPRGRGLAGPVADPRLQPLHRARLSTCGTACDQQELAVAVRLLAAVPLQPGDAHGGREPVPARLAAAARAVPRLRLQRAALPQPRRDPAARGRADPGRGRDGGAREVPQYEALAVRDGSRFHPDASSTGEG